jgi:hypothetical protein
VHGVVSRPHFLGSANPKHPIEVAVDVADVVAVEVAVVAVFDAVVVADDVADVKRVLDAEVVPVEV